MRPVCVISVFFVICLSGCVSQNTSCKELDPNHANALNIVFFQDGFSNVQFENLTNYFMSQVQAKEPFASKPYFNVFKVPNNNTAICRRGIPGPLMGGYSKSPLPPLQCNVTELLELINTCGVENAKIVIVTNDAVTSQTGISYADSAVMFINMQNQPPEIIQHEFAHFFGLVDEGAKLVSYADGPGRRPAPNCVTILDEAERSWRPFYPSNHSFSQGCAGERDWYKPEAGGLLDRAPDPSDTYGAFDTWYLGMAMDCCYAQNRTAYACDDFFQAYPQWTSCRE